jgi:predicted MFS family arabinose efflux permease
MFLGAAILIALVVAWALGARLSRLAQLRLRGGGLVFAALASQLLLFTGSRSPVPGEYQGFVHDLSYVFLLLFLALNRRLPGLWLAATGLLCNFVVITANGGRMPISLHAWTTTGRDPSKITVSGSYTNNVLTGYHTHLSWLGDVFALPASVPLSTAFSIGDLLILAGMTTFVYRACTGIRTVRAGGLVEVLRVRSFRRLLVGRAVSKLGDLLTMTAVVTWLYGRSHSTLEVSAFLIARIAAGSVGGLAAAPLLNRIPHFRTLTLVELLRGGLTLATGVSALFGHVAPVIALVCLSACIGAATSPSAASLVADLLPMRLVHLGNSLHGVSRNIVFAGGAALGALSVTMLGIGPALALDLATFLLAAALYRRFAASTAQEPPRPLQPHTSRRELARLLLSDRLVFGLTASFTVVTAALGLLNASLPSFFERQIHREGGYGYAMAAIGAGLLAGELLTGFITDERVARRSVAFAFTASAGTVLVLSRVEVAATAYLLLFMLGFSDGSTEIVRDTVFQQQLARRARAGVFAMASAAQNMGMVVGLGLAPIILALARGSTALGLAALGCLLGAATAGTALLGRTTGPKRGSLFAPQLRADLDT